MSVGLVVNCYERTYRDVLRPGYFDTIVASNGRPFDEVVALINNVDDPNDARERAEALLGAREISAYEFVSDHIDDALRAARLSRRVLRRRPYLLDYGLVMPHVVSTTWLLGWDAETSLAEAHNWVDPSIELLEWEPRIFHTSLSWVRGGQDDPGVAAETFAARGPWAFNWGFSDQLFFLRRQDLIGPVFRSFAPAALVRHAPHPYTFEYRIEAHQRATRRPRATLTTTTYATNNLAEGVIERTGRTRGDAVRIATLRKVEFHVIDRLPSWLGPRFSKAAPAGWRNASFGRR